MVGFHDNKYLGVRIYFQFLVNEYGLTYLSHSYTYALYMMITIYVKFWLKTWLPKLYPKNVSITTKHIDIGQTAQLNKKSKHLDKNEIVISMSDPKQCKSCLITVSVLYEWWWVA